MKALDENLHFDEARHLYFLKGRAVLNVTGILSACGITDFSSVNKDILDRACKFGRAVHKATELWDRKDLNLETLDAPLVPYLDAWKSFVEEEVSEFLFIEKAVYSLRNSFAGTVDRFFIDKKGRLTLCDIKTSAGMASAAVSLQTAGYEIAFEEMQLGKIARRVGVLLTKEGTFIPEEFTDKTDRDYFLACLRVAAFKVNHGLK